MLKDKLKNLGIDPKFIPGIYNYCDRWCERCPFTSRCLNYEISEEQFADPGARDMNNELFWQKLSETFQATLELVKEMMVEEGIDINSIDTEAIIRKKKKLGAEIEDHQLIVSAKEYSEMAGKWFDSAEELFLEKEIDLNKKAELELPNENPDKEAAGIKDAIEVILWYKHFIQVKLLRATRGELEDRPEILEDFPIDSDGSAKVALIAIDRLIAAWGEILRHFPDEEDELLNLLVKLERLRRNAEDIFPDARSFIRPGFDE